VKRRAIRIHFGGGGQKKARFFSRVKKSKVFFAGDLKSNIQVSRDAS
jgi:hypothetical protein